MEPELSYQLYRCFRCYKLFDSVGALDRHTFQHTGQKAYKCDLCQKSFISLKNCKLHVVSHIEDDIDMIADNTGDEQVKEPSMVYLDKDGEELSQCDLCGQMFEYEGQCRFHILSHLGNVDISDTQTLITKMEEQMMADRETTAIQNGTADLKGRLKEKVVDSEPSIFNKGEVESTNSEIKIENDTEVLLTNRNSEMKIHNEDEVTNTKREWNVYNEGKVTNTHSEVKMENDTDVMNTNSEQTINIYNEGEITKTSSELTIYSEAEVANANSEMSIYNEITNTNSEQNTHTKAAITNINSEIKIENDAEVINKSREMENNNEKRHTNSNINGNEKLGEARIIYHKTRHGEMSRYANSEQKDYVSLLQAGMAISKTNSKGMPTKISPLPDNATHVTIINNRNVGGVNIVQIQVAKIIKPRTGANTVPKDRLNANYGIPNGNTTKEVSVDVSRPSLMNQDTLSSRPSYIGKSTAISKPQAVGSQGVKIIKALTTVNSVPKDSLNANIDNPPTGNISKEVSVHGSRPTVMIHETSPSAFNVGKFSAVSKPLASGSATKPPTVGRTAIPVASGSATSNLQTVDSVTKPKAVGSSTAIPLALHSATAKQSQSILANEKSCKICKKEFVNAHQLNVHFEGNHTCELCSEVFMSHQIHMEKSHPDKKSKYLKRCHVCKAYFRSAAGYKVHMEKLHPKERIDLPETEFQCKKCKKYLSSAENLEWHLNMHSENKPFSCDVCSKSFRHPSTLHKHRVIHTGDRPYKCSLCPKDFNSSSIRNRHMLTHDNALPFCCKYCRKRIKTLKSLTNHEALCQTGNDKFSCPTCGHLFRTKETLRSHSLIHKEPRFRCQICGRGFLHMYQIKDHMKTHSDTKEHKCNECPAEFRTKSMLLYHQRNRHRSDKLECDICARKFTLESELEQHEALEHEIDPCNVHPPLTPL